MHVLLIEDDEVMANGVRTGLELNGFTVDHSASLAEARAALAALDTNLIVLDLGLPDGDGMTLLDELRRNARQVPVLILTARDAPGDRVTGLTAGADDYLLKPFDLDELVARLHALLRRTAGEHRAVLHHGALHVDPQRREARLGDHPVTLARREFDLLHALLQARGTILSPEQLKDSLYGLESELESNALNVHLHHLRRKLGTHAIETVRGIGYRLGPAEAFAAGDGDVAG